MSQDLFAAFGDPPVSTNDHGDFGRADLAEDAVHIEPANSSGHNLPVEDDDDFGDFEDANAIASGPHTSTTEDKTVASGRQKHPVPPSTGKKLNTNPVPPVDPKIGKHPFAGHMDFLFEGGDEEYDAGADDLDNLASNPEAAMAYSKRIIAEQESKARAKPDPSVAYAQQLAAHTKELSQRIPQASIVQANTKKLTKAASPVISKTKSASNPPPARNKLQKKSGYVPAKDPNILFDAENLSESDEAEDDFGDFEGGPTVAGATVITPAPPQPKAASAMPNIDLLGLSDNSTPPVPLGQIGRTRSSSLRQADTVLGPPKHKPSSSLSSVVSIPDDNPWADFETETPKAAAASSSTFPVSASTEDDVWDDFETIETAPTPAGKLSQVNPTSNHTRATSQLPPTNIPPPALLLSIFPSVLSSAQDALLTPLSKLDTTQRNQLLAHPASVKFLRTFLNSALVLAHIIAGRKLRWKRDQILSQSMRIGPAAAGGKGGMKLAGVDRSEVTKEEREVLDAVRLWKAQVGKLRGAVTGATAAGQKLPAVPDIGEQMPVRTLKAVEGGFVAPHACALCGMKREERIAKVDEAVEDSFGEWWVQGMDMHVFCKNWWEENKNKLRSR